MASVAKREWVYKDEKKSAWVVRYEQGGRHRSKQFAMKKQADTFRRKVEAMLASGEGFVDLSTATVAKACEEFIRDVDQRERDGRIGVMRAVGLRSAVKRSILPHIGHRLATSITQVDLTDLYALLRKDGLSACTAKDRILTYSLVERFGAKRGYNKVGPAKAALGDLRGIKQNRVKTFTADQVSELLATAAVRGKHKTRRGTQLVEVAVHLAAFCGLRLGEILGLQVENIDFAKRILKIRTSLLFNDQIKGPKTKAGVRDVPLPTHAIELLRAWISRYYVTNDRGLVFRSQTGLAIGRGNFHLLWQALLGRAGLRMDGGYHFHALRHFASSWMIHNGLPLTDVANLLGHEKFDMTLQVYAHPLTAPHLRHEVIESMVSAMPRVSTAPKTAQELRMSR